MSVSSWDAPTPFVLSSNALGTLNLNTQVSFNSGTGYYLLDPAACRWSVPLRVTNTNLPQKDGSQLHDRWDEGAELTLSIQLWETLDDIACDELLTEMVDELRAHLYQFRRPPLPAEDSRVLWTPDGQVQRMIKWAKLNETVEQAVSPPNPTVITAIFKSYYPYAMDAAEITDALPDTLVNTGSADFWPVIRVSGGGGGVSAFTITNTSVQDDDGNDLLIEFDASQIGADPIPAGDTLEIDMFQENMYLMSAGQANYKPGLVMSSSTFFPLQVGSNVITISGATADVLWQNAWY